MSNTVMFMDGVFFTCLVPQPPELTVVRLYSSITQQAAKGATDEVVVDGHQAHRGAGVLVIPDLQVMIAVESPDQAAADPILDSVRVVAVDSNGCAARVDRVGPPLEMRGPKIAQLVFDQPSSAVICRYSANRLSRSVPVRCGRSTSRW